MKDLITSVLDIVARRPARPKDLKALINTAPMRGHLLPNIAWTLFGLFVYRKRKWWAWNILQPYLAKDDATDGIVQEHPEWEYSLDHQDSYVVNRVSGEFIHLDAANGPELINASSFVDWIREKRTPAADRLLELHPSGDGIHVPLELLARYDLLHPSIEQAFRVCGCLYNYAQAIEEFVTAWRAPDERLWLAVQIGD